MLDDIFVLYFNEIFYLDLYIRSINCIKYG